MGFLQQLEDTLGTYGGAAKKFITNNDSVRVTNNLSPEDEERLYQARLAGMRKRADLKSMGDGMDAYEEGVESPDAMAAVEPDIDAMEAVEPELVDDSSAADMPMGFNEAVEAQLAADVPMPEATSETAVAQRDRVDSANTKRDASSKKDLADAEAYSKETGSIRAEEYNESPTEQAASQPLTRDTYLESLTQGSEAEAPEAEAPEAEAPEAEAPEAEAPEPNMDRAAKLFATTHGGDFDPKSSMDKAKMNTILEMMAKQPELNDMEEEDFEKKRNQFALSIYRL